MNYDEFLERNPVYGESVPFTEEELARLSGLLPDDLIGFYRSFGRCSFTDGLLSVVYPFDIDAKRLFEAWGFESGDYYIILKTCFGICIYFYQGKYYFLNPQEGYYDLIGSNLHSLLNLTLVLDLTIIELYNYETYKIEKDNLPVLNADEIYVLEPSVPLGGSFDTSYIESGDMMENLCLLA